MIHLGWASPTVPEITRSPADSICGSPKPAGRFWDSVDSRCFVSGGVGSCPKMGSTTNIGVSWVRNAEAGQMVDRYMGVSFFVVGAEGGTLFRVGLKGNQRKPLIFEVCFERSPQACPSTVRNCEFSMWNDWQAPVRAEAEQLGVPGSRGQHFEGFRGFSKSDNGRWFLFGPLLRG